MRIDENECVENGGEVRISYTNRGWSLLAFSNAHFKLGRRDLKETI
jgi:hypothetical protein